MLELNSVGVLPVHLLGARITAILGGVVEVDLVLQRAAHGGVVRQSTVLVITHQVAGTTRRVRRRRPLAGVAHDLRSPVPLITLVTVRI